MDPKSPLKMHTIRKWIRFLFGFSRRETNGFLILLPLMVIAVFSQPVFRMLVRRGPPDFSREAAILDSLEAVIRDQNEPAGKVHEVVARPFAFDPNRATAAELESLGFSSRVARTILNYREKGGHFRQKSDLLKIYGLDSADFTRLYKFIDLPEVATVRSATSARRAERPAIRIKPLAEFDLNEADTAALKKIRGIGPVLAERIVRYREILGGFVGRHQLHEVYRLDSAVVEALFQAAYIGKDFSPRTIPLNTSDEYNLSMHPYIGKVLAKMIVAYRYQHGPFEHIGDLRRIHHVDDSVFQRIHPYLSLD